MKGWLATTFADYPLSVTPQELASAANLYAAMRHFHGICILVEGDAHASAFALLRVVWQALLNGAWLYSSCPEHQLEQYLSGSRDFPKIPTMLKQIETHLQHEMVESGIFTTLQVRIGTLMHNHTHVGIQQLKRLVSDAGVTESFSAFELNVLLMIVTRMALMAAALLAVVADDHQLEQAVRDRLIAFSTKADEILAAQLPQEGRTSPDS